MFAANNRRRNACFFIRNILIGNTRLKFAKNQAKAKQHPEAERWLFENYFLSSSTLLSKNYRRYSKKRYKKQVRMIDGNENESKNEKKITKIQHN